MSKRGGELVAKKSLDGENEDDHHAGLKSGVQQVVEEGGRGRDHLVHGLPSVWFG